MSLIAVCDVVPVIRENIAAERCRSLPPIEASHERP